MPEFLRSAAVRLALAFVLVTTVATTAVFGLVYLEIREANEKRNRLILEDEAAKSADRSIDELRNAFEVRLTHDLRDRIVDGGQAPRGASREKGADGESEQQHRRKRGSQRVLDDATKRKRFEQASSQHHDVAVGP